MADLIFDMAKEYIGDGTIDLDDDTLKMMLLADTYTPDQTDSVKADIVAHELAGASGYSTGGYTLQNVTWANVAGVTTLDADDPVWSSASFTCRYAVAYSDTPSSPADPLLCLLDLGENKTAQGGNFYITLHASGLMSAT
jgi:hypothetical protein